MGEHSEGAPESFDGLNTHDAWNFRWWMGMQIAR